MKIDSSITISLFEKVGDNDIFLTVKVKTQDWSNGTVEGVVVIEVVREVLE